MQRCERAELLGNQQRRVVRQHDAARTYSDAVGTRSDVGERDGRRRGCAPMRKILRSVRSLSPSNGFVDTLGRIDGIRFPPGTLGQRVLTEFLSGVRRFNMGFRPLHDRVVIRRVEAEEKTTGGIIIPDTAKEKPMEGEVVSVGPGARGEDGKIQPLDVKAGDRVLFGKWSGTEVKLDGEDLIIMKESDIMGIIDAAAIRKAA